MYDGTDVALVLGGLVSAGLAALFLIAAGISLAFLAVRKWKNETAPTWVSRKWVGCFAGMAVFCGLSIPSGMAVYDLFEHQRGVANPPSHVFAVAVASVWGPVAAGGLGIYCLRRKETGPFGRRAS